MASTKPSAWQAFELNIADAHLLVDLAKTLENRRTRRMRRELRDKVGAALGLAKKKWVDLECIQNDRVFIVLMPGAADLRHEFASDRLRPLLRQAIVAACAAVETFVADRAMELYPQAVRQKPVPSRLGDVQLDVATWLWIEDRYSRRGHGLRMVVDSHVRQHASAHPDPMGIVFSTVGQSDIFRRVDKHRGVPAGSTRKRLEEIAERRNRIAHTGDRKGTGRALITVSEAEAVLADVRSIVEALDAVTSPS